MTRLALLLLSLGLLASGCGRSRAPAKRELCEAAVKHVMALGAGRPEGAELSAADTRLQASTVELCRKEGLSPAQAECILAAKTDADLSAVRSCAAIAAQKPGWLALPPTEQETAAVAQAMSPAVGPVTSPLSYRQLVGSPSGTCGLLESGGLQCWGQRVDVPSGTFAQVGWRWHLCGLDEAGKLTCAPHFAGEDLAFLPAEPLATFAEGMFHGCGIVKASGALICWSKEGWSGDGGEVKLPAGKFVQVASGTGFTCALGADGKVSCFGPQAPPPPKGLFRALAAADKAACGVGKDGALTCWGEGPQKEALAPQGSFKDVSCAPRHCCALAEEGTVTCWGDRDSGQTVAPAVKATTVMAAAGHSCASGPEGTVCWGGNQLGQTAVPKVAGEHAFTAAP